MVFEKLRNYGVLNPSHTEEWWRIVDFRLMLYRGISCVPVHRKCDVSVNGRFFLFVFLSLWSCLLFRSLFHYFFVEIEQLMLLLFFSVCNTLDIHSHTRAHTAHDRNGVLTSFLFLNSYCLWFSVVDFRFILFFFVNFFLSSSSLCFYFSLNLTSRVLRWFTVVWGFFAPYQILITISPQSFWFTFAIIIAIWSIILKLFCFFLFFLSRCHFCCMFLSPFCPSILKPNLTGKTKQKQITY